MTTVNRPAAPVAFSPAPSSYNQQWQSTFNAQLQRRLGLLAGPYTIQQQLLLQSPDGTVWQVTVSNAGALTVAQATHGSISPPV